MSSSIDIVYELTLLVIGYWRDSAPLGKLPPEPCRSILNGVIATHRQQSNPIQNLGRRKVDKREKLK